MKTKVFGLLLVIGLINTATADLMINSPVTDWFAVSYSLNYPDYFADQQTGQYNGDIVGDLLNPAFYFAFDGGGTPSLTDGTMAFRLRISGSAKTYWDNYAWVGIDADLDGSIDLYTSLAKNKDIDIHLPGNNLNISPSTTSILTPDPQYSTAVVDGSNYSFMKVDSINAPGLLTDVDNYPTGNKDGTDWFVSFSVSFDYIVAALATEGITMDENSALSFIAATSTQDNSLNQDLNGAPAITRANSANTWAQLGAASVPYDLSGQVVPEPAAVTFIVLGGVVMLASSRLRRNR